MHDRERAARALADLTGRCAQEPGLAQLRALLARRPIQELLAGVLGASPYLASLIERDPEALQDALSASPEQRFDLLVDRLSSAAEAGSMPAAMRALRLFKSDIALLAASKIVESSLSPEAQRKLVNETIANLPKAAQ